MKGKEGGREGEKEGRRGGREEGREKKWEGRKERKEREEERERKKGRREKTESKRCGGFFYTHTSNSPNNPLLLYIPHRSKILTSVYVFVPMKVYLDSFPCPNQESHIVLKIREKVYLKVFFNK